MGCLRAVSQGLVEGLLGLLDAELLDQVLDLRRVHYNAASGEKADGGQKVAWPRRMRKHRWIIAGSLLVLLGAGGFAYWFDLLPLPEVEDADCPLRPVSVFVEDPRSNIPYLASGQTAWWKNGANENVIWVAKDTDWKTAPHPQVKAYPKLKSSRPLFGAIDFGKGRIEPGTATAHYFAVGMCSPLTESERRATEVAEKQG